MNKMLKLSFFLALMLVLSAAIPVVAQDDETVVIGTNAEYEPFEFTDDDDNIIGFDIDLMNAIAEDAGLTVEYVNTRWEGIFVALSEGEFDAVISAATITDDREDIIDFSDPYYDAGGGQSIAVLSERADEITSVEDLEGLVVGVQAGTTGDLYASELEGVEVDQYDEITLAFQALASGAVDAIINDEPNSAEIIANNPDIDAVIVVTGLTEEFYGIAVNPERTDLLDAINTSLANLIADGTYAALYEEWFGEEPPEAFMPADAGEDMALEVDRTDPESTIFGLVAAFFDAETPADLLPFACENANPESPLMPDQDTLNGIAGIDVDLSEFSVTIEENDDGSVSATPGGSLLLIIGDAEPSPVAASAFSATLGIDSITLYENEDGEWEICPE